MTRVVVVDDEPVTGQGIAAFLRDLGYEVTGTASSLQAAVTLIRRDCPDVVVCDVMLDGHPSGLDLPVQLRGLGLGDIPVLYLSSYDMAYLVERAREAGAMGYLSKGADPVTLLAAIGAVLEGTKVFPSRASAPRAPSAREIEVITLVASGLPNSSIGERLGLSVRTIEGHLGRMFDRYDAPDRSRLVTLALERGWITVADIVDWDV